METPLGNLEIWNSRRKISWESNIKLSKRPLGTLWTLEVPVLLQVELALLVEGI